MDLNSNLLSMIEFVVESEMAIGYQKGRKKERRRERKERRKDTVVMIRRGDR